MRKIEKPPFRKKGLVFKVLQDPKIIELNESSYPYWDKWKYISKELKQEPKELWFFVKVFLRSRWQQIRFDGPHDLQLHLNTPLAMQEQLHQLDLNMGGSLHAGELIPSEEKQRYLVSSLMEEAIASSQLEGAATTRRIAKEMLESNRRPTNHSEQMIVNNYRAMQWIIENKNARLDESAILQLHKVITHDTLHSRDEEGAFRKDDDVKVIDVQTGSIIHTPPSYKQLDRLMEEFCRFANDHIKEGFFLHPIAKSIILHFLIGYIHPFADGNGRTARALFYWYLVRKGYWLIEYMSVSRIILRSKAQYARAYQHTELDENDLTYFILYNLKAVRIAFEDLRLYVARKNKEKQELLILLRNTDYNDRQIVLLQELLNHKKDIYTVNELETRFGVSNQTARNDLNHLVEKAILEPRKSGKKIQFISTGDIEKKLK